MRPGCYCILKGTLRCSFCNLLLPCRLPTQAPRLLRLWPPQPLPPVAQAAARWHAPQRLCCRSLLMQPCCCCTALHPLMIKHDEGESSLMISGRHTLCKHPN